MERRVGIRERGGTGVYRPAEAANVTPIEAVVVGDFVTSEEPAPLLKEALGRR